MLTGLNINITDTDSAAFYDGEIHQPENEVARILRELALKIEQGHRPAVLHDANGNMIGTVEYDEADAPEYAEQDVDESMDGDFDTGMASAGFGTTEDYRPGEDIDSYGGGDGFYDDPFGDGD